VPNVKFGDEARAQFRHLPAEIKSELAEIFPWLERNPLHMPPWVDVKLLGEERGKKVLRIRVKGYRAVFTFDGQVVKFVRIRGRTSIDYAALPKT
jgi:mRNA-degrading endonuclease RelE of RelBE toxin-antitoxin system